MHSVPVPEDSVQGRQNAGCTSVDWIFSREPCRVPAQHAMAPYMQATLGQRAADACSVSLGAHAAFEAAAEASLVASPLHINCTGLFQR